jgi:hypothetical protein
LLLDEGKKYRDFRREAKSFYKKATLLYTKQPCDPTIFYCSPKPLSLSAGLIGIKF